MVVFFVSFLNVGVFQILILLGFLSPDFHIMDPALLDWYLQFQPGGNDGGSHIKDFRKQHFRWGKKKSLILSSSFLSFFMKIFICLFFKYLGFGTCKSGRQFLVE